jgi:XTP/dITP diphosphohydrolase
MRDLSRGMQRIIIATKNAHKTAEFRAMLGADYEVVDLTAFPEIPAAEENGATFEENAAIKALHAAAQFDGWVLADDSGLEVDALGGAPGVISARYSGEGATDLSNRERLIGELRKLEGDSFSARFRCVLCVAERGAVLGKWSGAVEGIVVPEERGGGGFGYDPLFIPNGESGTFAELPAEVKNRLSHRARAFAAFSEWLASR